MSDEPAAPQACAQERALSASARTIIRNYWREHSARQIATLLVEQYLGLLLRWLPGIEGVAFRSCFYRLLFRRLEGFAFIYPGAWLDHSYNISAGPSRSINTGAYISARAPIRFGSSMLVGPNAVILAGVSVADGTIVSAGAVVTRDTEPYSIVGGSPATKIGQRPRDAG